MSASFSCILCLSWNLFLRPCLRLICLEQSSHRTCTKEQRMCDHQTGSFWTHCLCPLNPKALECPRQAVALTSCRVHSEEKQEKVSLAASREAVTHTWKLASKACHWVTKDSDKLITHAIHSPVTAITATPLFSCSPYKAGWLNFSKQKHIST